MANRTVSVLVRDFNLEESPLYISITHSKKRQIRYRLPDTINPKLFKKKGKRKPGDRRTFADDQTIDETLVKYVNDSLDYLDKFKAQRKRFPILSELKNYFDEYFAKPGESGMIKDMESELFLKAKKSSKGTPIATNTIITRGTTIAKLKEYARLEKIEITYGNINRDFIKGFAKWLETKGGVKRVGKEKIKVGLKNSAVSTYVLVLKHFLTIALDEGKHNNADYNYKYRRIDTDRREGLTKDQVNQLKELKFDAENLRITRDCWLLAFYSGQRHSDCKFLIPENSKTIDGIEVITFKITKTRKDHIVPLFPEIKELWDKYDNKVPMLSLGRLNIHLKVIAKKIGLEDLQFHDSRRSRAQVLYDDGVNINDIQALTAHSSEEMLRRYINRPAQGAIARLLNYSML